MVSPTLHDVARLAGVSYATADRVVNRRGNVAEKSLVKVQRAVAQLGYVRDVAAANLSRNRRYRLAFVLPHRSHAFFGRIHAQLRLSEPRLKAARIAIEIIEFDVFEAERSRDALAGLAGEGYDGVAVVGQVQGPSLGMIAALRAAGTKVVTLVSDAPADCRDYYIGIDNRKAGRTAARLVGMAHAGQAGHVILTLGAQGLRDHGDRIAGFRAVMAADYPQITVSDPVETLDSDRRMRALAQAQFDAQPQPTAVYNAGAGNDGLIDALRVRAAPERRLYCVVHELTGKTRGAMEAGVIDAAIDQRPEIETTRALALFQALIEDHPPTPMPELTPTIFLRDNLPDDIHAPRKAPNT